MATATLEQVAKRMEKSFTEQDLGTIAEQLKQNVSGEVRFTVMVITLFSGG